MNVWLTLEAKNADTWALLLPKIRFYQEETALRVEEAPDKHARGVKLKCSDPDAQRLLDIFTKAGLIGALDFSIERILPQDDPDEAKILKTLYRGGDTSEKPEDTFPREVRTDLETFYMTREEYAEYMKGTGRRAT